MIAVSARVAVDLKLFQHIVQEGPITSARLAELSGAEELLISECYCICSTLRQRYLSNKEAQCRINDPVRILRPLSAVHLVEEVDSRTWTATPVTKAMATEEIAAGHRMMLDILFHSSRLSAFPFLSHLLIFPFFTDKSAIIQLPIDCSSHAKCPSLLPPTRPFLPQ